MEKVSALQHTDVESFSQALMYYVSLCQTVSEMHRRRCTLSTSCLVFQADLSSTLRPIRLSSEAAAELISWTGIKSLPKWIWDDYKVYAILALSESHISMPIIAGAQKSVRHKKRR